MENMTEPGFNTGPDKFFRFTVGGGHGRIVGLPLDVEVLAAEELECAISGVTGCLDRELQTTGDLLAA